MRKLIKTAVRRSMARWIPSILSDQSIRANPYITGKFLPAQGREPYYVQLAGAKGSDRGDALPVPPRELWEGWGPAEKDYLTSGSDDVASMLAILNNAGAFSRTLQRVLDFGCAAGRMLRFYPRTETESDLWGVDIKAKHIVWCQQHLSPPYSFATVTTAPHLPFEDNHFDLVYCASVFTHMSELADAWFLELRRVIRKGGYAYITIHDKNSVKILLGRYKDRVDHLPVINSLRAAHRQTSVLSQDYECLAIGAEPAALVFYDADYLVRKWSRFAQLVSITPEAMDYQSALLWKK